MKKSTSVKNKLEKYQRKVAISPAENDLDKIKRWFFQQDTTLLPHDQRIELSETQEEKKDRLFKIWAWLINNPMEDVVIGIKKEFEVSDRQARNLINQSQELFGFIKSINLAAQKNLRIDQREQMIKQIRKDQSLTSYERYELINKNMERIEKMIGLDRPDVISMDELKEMLELPDTEFSTDPETLTIDVDGEVID